MPNFKQDILDAVGEEVIECVKIHHNRDYYDDKSNKELLNVKLTWEQAAPLFNYTYNDGFGGTDCHDITVWTATRVYYIHEYDGSTALYSVERNP